MAQGTRYPVGTCNGRESEEEYIRVSLNPFAVHLELTQHGRLSRVQLKKKLFRGGQERSDPYIYRAVVTVADFSSLCAGLCFTPVRDVNASDPPPGGDWSMLQCADSRGCDSL